MLTRSGLVQMDEVEGLRLRQSSEDSVSLAPSLAEPINLEGQQFSRTFHFLPILRSSDTREQWCGVFLAHRLALCSDARGAGVHRSEPGGRVLERGRGPELPQVPEQRGCKKAGRHLW